MSVIFFSYGWNMEIKQAKAFFSSGPEDKLRTKDVYADKGIAIVNAGIFSGLSGFGFGMNLGVMGSMSGILGSIGGGLSGLTGALNQAMSGINGALGSLSQLQNGFGGFPNLASQVAGQLGISGSIVNTVLGASGSISMSNFGGLSAVVSGGLSNLMGGDMASLNAVIGQASRVYGQIQQTSRTLERLDSSLGGFDTRDRESGYGNRVSLDDISDQLANGNADILSAISDLPAQTRNDLLVGTTSSNFTGNIAVNVNGNQTVVSNKQPAQAIKPIMDIVTGLTGGTFEAEVVNRGGQAALIAGVTHMANKANIPGVFGAIAEHIEDREVLVAAAKPIVVRAAVQADVEALKSVAISKIGKDIKSMAPAVIEEVSRNAVKPATLTQQEYTKYYQGMREAFDTIDPNWMVKDRAGTPVVNGTVIGNNRFMADLMTAQLNELMDPDNVLSNYQRASQVQGLDASTTLALKDKLEAVQSLAPNEPLNFESVKAVDHPFTPTGSGVDPKDLTIKLKEDDGTVVTVDFSLEPYLLLAAMWPSETVDQAIRRDFPEFYLTLDAPLQPCDF